MAARPTPPGAPDAELDATLRLVRRRWRLRVALGGLAALVLAALAALVAGAYAMEVARFAPASVLAARALVAAAVLAVGGWFLVRPATRRLPDARVALYLEEREPSLGAALLSAVEVRGAAAGASPAIARRLVADAAERARAVDYGRRVERPGLRRGGAAAAGAVAAAAALLLLGPAFVRSGARAVFWPFGDEAAAAAAPGARLAVTPGDAQVPRGGDLSVRAVLHGGAAEDAVVLLRRGAAAEWERVPMTPGAAAPGAAGGYAARLLDLDSAAQYQVEAGGARSPVYAIRVVDRPFARRVALEYRFPAYTGLPAQRVDDGGDVAAVRGTAVRVRVTPSVPARAGRLVVEGGAAVPLAPGDSGALEGVLRVDRPGSYRVELAGADGAFGSASLDYLIDVLPDRPPTVAVSEPGRDVPVTRLEEVFASVDADDDYGVARVELVYTVNGGPEQTVALHSAGARRTPEVTAGHTFYLEELPLRPGDVVSYYARARDNDAVSGAHTASTDIYFLRVRPFGQTYRQADQQGGGGERGETAEGLSERQRQIVSATHKLVRAGAAAPERQRREDLATLALAQGRLREQVARLAERVRERGGLAAGALGATAGDSALRQIAEALPLAESEMRAAEEQLGRRRPGDALPPEQRALQQLQRAEAAYREVQVSFGGGDASAGGGGATPEELADLFGLDADRLRNQYETVRRGAAERDAARAEVDRTMERLRELAARQQRESERMRREGEALRQAAGQQAGAGGSAGSSGGGSAGGTSSGGGDAQRQLAQEAEQLARQLERLQRDEPSPALAQGARQLQAAADEMRRAAAASPEGAAAAAAAARARLEAARQRLAAGRAAEGDRGMQEARRQAAALADEQRRVGADAERLARGEGRGGEAERRVDERKLALEAGVGALEGDLDRLARELRRDNPEAARRMQGAADAIRDGQLRERLRFSREVARRGSAEYARNLEQQIGATLDDVRARVDGAASAVRAPAGQAGARSAERARELARGVSSLGERLRQRREEARGGAAGGGQGGQQQAAGGQPGQQSGQQSGPQPGPQGGGQQGGGQQGVGQQRGLAQGNAAGGQPGGEGGGQSRPGAGGGPGPRGAGSGTLAPGDARQFAREMAERRADAESLRRGLAREGIPTAELEALIGRMRALERERAYDDPEEAARLQAAVADGLKAFEFALRRRLEGPGADPVRLGAGDQVPAGFRALVEEYYRSLARGAGGR